MAKARSLGHIKGQTRLTTAARQVLRARVADVADWRSCVDQPDAVAELHNMRIASKRLRYSLELLQTGVGPDAIPLLDSVQKMQEMLGAIHDADVLLEMIRQRIAISALREGLALADTIVAAHGVVKEQAALPSELRGLYLLLAAIASQREAHYKDFRTWWTAHDTLLDQLDALVAEPTSTKIEAATP